MRQLRASSINGEKLQCAIYFIPESMISEVTLVTNITRYSHIFFKTSICGTYRAPTEITCVFAARAAIWFLTTVDQNVSLQGPTLGKCLFTPSTSELDFFTVEINVYL